MSEAIAQNYVFFGYRRPDELKVRKCMSKETSMDEVVNSHTGLLDARLGGSRVRSKERCATCHCARAEESRGR